MAERSGKTGIWHMDALAPMGAIRPVKIEVRSSVPEIIAITFVVKRDEYRYSLTTAHFTLDKCEELIKNLQEAMQISRNLTELKRE
ncbi:MAG: hypothetical protein PHX53_08850 [Syntrophales bacterium]|nr:hypothetical protein [Syntrophales bacterium]